MNVIKEWCKDLCTRAVEPTLGTPLQLVAIQRNCEAGYGREKLIKPFYINKWINHTMPIIRILVD